MRTSLVTALMAIVVMGAPTSARAQQSAPAQEPVQEQGAREQTRPAEARVAGLPPAEAALSDAERRELDELLSEKKPSGKALSGVKASEAIHF